MMILIKTLINFLLQCHFQLKCAAGAIFEAYLRKIIDFPYGTDQNVIKLIVRKMSAAGESFPYFSLKFHYF